MKIGIIGAGKVGTGLGKRLAAKGHDIIVSFARTLESVEAAARTIGGDARAGTPEQAARHGDIVIIATTWGTTLDAVRQIATSLAGKIVWDTTNPLNEDMSGLTIGTTTSASEEIAKAAPGATIVKAIAPFAEVLHSPSMLIDGRKPSVFVASDDANARKVVLRLIADIDAAGVNAGPLRLARFTEPLGMLLTQLAYVQGFGARIGCVLIEENGQGSPPPA
jgi:predicted dinucleotide-binding enzyme